ncbi:hypothetical protein Fmac_016285 [Flemingia macrophylla]|uniref:YTH domain-containing family protein n=1 Tax=Flemingia macrophylla TaxID=520843 RepID=A0ABD1MHP5_9FABA
MSTHAPSSDTSKAADLLQNLSLDSKSKTTAVLEPVNKASIFTMSGPTNGETKPFNLNASFVPNGHPSTAYYYGGYDTTQVDWNIYSKYANLYGGMAQGVLGDNCSYLYHQGYGYTPYGASMHHDDEVYGMQQYQYPCSYYQSPASADGSFAADKINSQQGKISNAASGEHVPSSAVINKGSTAGYQDPRVGSHGTQKALSSDPSPFSDKSNDGKKIGLSAQVVAGKKFSSQRNIAIPQPPPQSMLAFHLYGIVAYLKLSKKINFPQTNLPFRRRMNLHGSLHSTGLEPFSGFFNRMYPSNTMYSQYGNTYRASSHFGPAPYGYKTGSFNNKHKALSGGRIVDHAKKNMDGFGELNKGPRSSNGSDDKSVKGPVPVTLLLRGQDLPIKSDNKEVSLVPSKEQCNGEDFPENFSDAKFFVIKSYSEDDIHKSIKYSVWASTLSGNKKLDAAYHQAKENPGYCPVFLLFSVNTSGQFVGLAEMVSPVDFGRTLGYWQQDRWTGCFSVKWHIIKDIPNGLLRHITLENNENKPVTNSRDTQEVKFEKGIEILKIFKELSSKTCILDDFDFYEIREKMIHERKSKELQFSKQVSKSNDLTTNGTAILPESHDGAVMNEPATTDEAGRKEKLVEVKGLTQASM